MAYMAIGELQTKHNKWCCACGNTNLEIKETCDPHRKHENHLFLVYMHVNKVNGKVYVGLTHHINPYKRWGYSGESYQHSTKFINAIRKYGWDNFEHIVLCRTNRERAIIIEKTMIAYYKRLGISYNLCDGGEGTSCISEENRRAISERMKANHPMKGKHHTAEARAKISEAGRRRVYTMEQKRQLAEAAKIGREIMRNRGWWMSEEGKKKTAMRFSRPVLQLDKNGNIINEFSSAKEADEFYSSGKGHHISDVCNGKRKTAYGYIWKYKDERRVA